MKFLVTGGAGFIGFHVAKKLICTGHCVVVVDNLNDYYDPTLKQARLKQLAQIASEAGNTNYRFEQLDITDGAAITALFKAEDFEVVIHLAAQCGVSYSLENPHSYIAANIVGFTNILEACRSAAQTDSPLKHLLFASSSSIYGMNEATPFAVDHNTDHPISLYAATKKSNELMAYTYSHLFAIPTTGLRFFTVYGPWGRPDMAYFKFTDAIMNQRSMDVYNPEVQTRDFTYIDDIVNGLLGLVPKIPEQTTAAGTKATAPYAIYNIGNDTPILLDAFIKVIEKHCGKQAIRNILPGRDGDVLHTHADISALTAVTGFQPSTSVDEGIANFVAWYRNYYGDTDS